MAKGKKGRFLLTQGMLVAFEDEGFAVDLNNKKYTRTIRTSQCDILIHGDKCGPTLRAMQSHWSKKPQSPKTPMKFTNNRYLNTPEKLKKLLEKKVCLLSKKLPAATVPVDVFLNTHLVHRNEEGSKSIAHSFPYRILLPMLMPQLDELQGKNKF